ncbi:MAG: hypothetical protein AAF968_00475 [Pseudomonadota bacterium]
MLTITHTCLGSIAERAIAWVRRLAAALTRHHAKQRAYERMLSMRDRDLQDIGLTRDDVLRALSEPPVWDRIEDRDRHKD